MQRCKIKFDLNYIFSELVWDKFKDLLRLSKGTIETELKEYKPFGSMLSSVSLLNNNNTFYNL